MFVGKKIQSSSYHKIAQIKSGKVLNTKITEKIIAKQKRDTANENNKQLPQQQPEQISCIVEKQKKIIKDNTTCQKKDKTRKTKQKQQKIVQEWSLLPSSTEQKNFISRDKQQINFKKYYQKAKNDTKISNISALKSQFSAVQGLKQQQEEPDDQQFAVDMKQKYIRKEKQQQNESEMSGQQNFILFNNNQIELEGKYLCQNDGLNGKEKEGQNNEQLNINLDMQVFSLDVQQILQRQYFIV